MFEKLNRLTNWQAALIITVLGFAVFFGGLSNSFQGDDVSQILNNAPVQSISNVKLFFEGGTFYDGGGLLVPLSGIYYRPLMTVVFSLIYTTFGAHAFFFHLLQLMLCIGSTILLYLFFRFSFRALLALVLSLIFLVHPIDSQVVYAIPSMQDALFFFFGILGLYLLFRYKSVRILLVVALCFFLSLLAKETAILFIAMGLLYLFWFNRRRLYTFAGIMILPIILWLVLKSHAVGLNSNPNNAPIDNVKLAGRVLNDPSVVLFYLTKFIFPQKLAIAYYWVHPTFSIRYTLLPLLVDLTVVALVVYVAIQIHRKASKAKYLSFLFFAIWAAIGIGFLLQLDPLDMTVSETWFYFPMVGFLGMIGVAVNTLVPSMERRLRIDHRVTAVVIAVLLIALGVRTATAASVWKNSYTVAFHAITVSKEDYPAYNTIALYYFDKGDYYKAKDYATQSVDLYPAAVNNNTLGQTLLVLKDYPEAHTVLENGLKYLKYYPLYENLAALTPYYGSTASNRSFLIGAVDKFPQDSRVWLYLAILDYRNNDTYDAQFAIAQAHKYDLADALVTTIYDRMMSNAPLNIDFSR